MQNGARNNWTREDLVAAFELMEGRFEGKLHGGMDRPEQMADETMAALEAGTNAVVYGAGGWHRYFVTEERTIVFSVRHCCDGRRAELHVTNARDLEMEAW